MNGKKVKAIRRQQNKDFQPEHFKHRCKKAKNFAKEFPGSYTGMWKRNKQEV